MAISCRWVALSLLSVAGCMGPGSGAAVLNYSPSRSGGYNPVLSWQATDLPGAGGAGVGDAGPSGFTHRATFYGMYFADCSDCTSASVDDVTDEGIVVGHWHTATATPKQTIGPRTVEFTNVDLVGGCYVIAVVLVPNRPSNSTTVKFKSSCLAVPVDLGPGWNTGGTLELVPLAGRPVPWRESDQPPR